MMSDKRREVVARSVQTLATFAPLSRATVLEIGADQDAIGANALLSVGAKKVFSTNFGMSWPNQVVSDHLESRRADARRLTESFEQHSVDVIFGIAVLEHINGLAQFFESAAAVLKPGGIFFVHGGPIWSSAKGHHVNAKGEKMHYRFGVQGANPIPDWWHLVHTKDSMIDSLVDRGLPQGDAEKIGAWTYESAGINRVGYRSMHESFVNSRLVFVEELPRAFQFPEDVLLAAIKRGPYGDQERYDISGCTFVGRAPS